MISFKNLSIENKIILIMMIACIITMIVTCVTFAAYNTIIMRKLLIDETSTLADLIANNSTDSILLKDRKMGEKELSTLSTKKQIEFASIHNDNGELIAIYRNDNANIEFEPPAADFYGSEFKDKKLMVRKRVMLEKENIGTILLISNTKEIYSFLNQYLYILIFIIHLLILVAYFLARELQYFISKPILHITNIAKEVSEKKDYSIRAKSSADDEVGFLVNQFNVMLDQIQAKEKDLTDINTNLDTLVKDRTKKLVKEIDERKKAEEIAQNSLIQKDLLLKEIHHRVKNNLQIISSILNLQSDGIEDESALDMFSESQDRINSMALIHERLYRSSEFEYVDFSTYMNDLINYLISSYHSEASNIEITTDIQKINLNIETAVPCGLIVNELIINAIKHAFPDKNAGKINISLEKTLLNNEYLLSISDNGIGIKDGINIENTNTLGLQLVYNLVQQLDGKINIEKNSGTKFDIHFHELIYKQRH